MPKLNCLWFVPTLASISDLHPFYKLHCQSIAKAELLELTFDVESVRLWSFLCSRFGFALNQQFETNWKERRSNQEWERRRRISKKRSTPPSIECVTVVERTQNTPTQGQTKHLGIVDKGCFCSDTNKILMGNNPLVSRLRRVHVIRCFALRSQFFFWAKAPHSAPRTRVSRHPINFRAPRLSIVQMLCHKATCRWAVQGTCRI
jgi:hypothetical protein